MRFQDLSFRTKLLISHIGTVMIVVVALTLTMTLTASRRATNDYQASLALLTNQVLVNFNEEVESADQYLFSRLASTQTASQMAVMENLTQGGYLQAMQELLLNLSKLIGAQAPYDSALLKLADGAYVANYSASRSFVAEAKALLDTEEYAAVRYGEPQWVRTPGDLLLLIRDVYDTSPLRHVGKAAVSIRLERLANLNQYDGTLDCGILFFDEYGRFLTATGAVQDGMAEAVSGVLGHAADVVEIENSAYFITVHTNGAWTAVGLMPMKTVKGVQNAILGSSLFVAALCTLLSALLAFAITRRMTRQVSTLVTSMDAVAAGNVDLAIAVDSKDEIGQLAVHFNQMTARTRWLLQQVVLEEANKRKAEYEILEYKYFSLQSQINPHFIYNALEIVNAQAKLDGSDEISDMIQRISAYFRQCTNNARNKYITVQQEFDGLAQYAYIYQKIHGDTLRTSFHCDDDMSDIMIPTMIVQPLLENALIHGMNAAAEQTVVETAAWQEDDDHLVIEIRDNGCGMSADTIRRIFSGEAETGEAKPQRNGIGVRNVLDRLQLIYGDTASMSIQSTENEGTVIRMRIPLRPGPRCHAVTNP